MLDLVIAIFLALISAGIGKRLLEWLGECPEHPADVAALAVPLGLGLLAISCLAIAEAGWTLPERKSWDRFKALVGLMPIMYGHWAEE